MENAASLTRVACYNLTLEMAELCDQQMARLTVLEKILISPNISEFRQFEYDERKRQGRFS